MSIFKTRWRRRSARLAIALRFALRARAAWGADGITVQVDECENLSGPQLDRLLQLELQTSGGGEAEATGVQLTLRCTQESVTMTAAEQGTRRKLSREVLIAEDAPDAERVLSISAAQLVRALAWLPDETSAVRGDTTPTLATAPPPSKPEPRRPASSLRADLSGGLLRRGFVSPLVLVRVRLGADMRVAPALRLGPVFSYESGVAHRDLGDARVELFGAALRIAWALWRAPTASLELRGTAGVDHARLWGSRPNERVLAGRISGFGADAGFDFGPTARVSQLTLRCALAARIAYFGGRALVSSEDPVSLDGGWAGAEISIGWAADRL